MTLSSLLHSGPAERLAALGSWQSDKVDSGQGASADFTSSDSASATRTSEAATNLGAGASRLRWGWWLAGCLEVLQAGCTLLVGLVVYVGLLVGLAIVLRPWQLATRGGPKAYGYGISMLAHATAVFLLASWILVALAPPPWPEQIQAQTEEIADRQFQISSPVLLQEAVEGDVDMQAVTGGGGAPEIAVELAELRLPNNPVLGWGIGLERGMGLDQKSGLQQGGQHQQTGSGESATFFGVTAAGKSFVFIVDISGSMSRNARYTRAMDELRRSLRSLVEGQKFGVVLYNDVAFPLTGTSLISVSRQALLETENRLRRQSPGGGTNPLMAVAAALQMKPDAIFLLTDGEFATHLQILALCGQQEQPIPVHALCFVNRAAERYMAALAQQTGGVYRFVR